MDSILILLDYLHFTPNIKQILNDNQGGRNIIEMSSAELKELHQYR